MDLCCNCKTKNGAVDGKITEQTIQVQIFAEYLSGIVALVLKRLLEKKKRKQPHENFVFRCNFTFFLFIMRYKFDWKNETFWVQKMTHSMCN